MSIQEYAPPVPLRSTAHNGQRPLQAGVKSLVFRLINLAVPFRLVVNVTLVTGIMNVLKIGEWSVMCTCESMSRCSGTVSIAHGLNKVHRHYLTQCACQTVPLPFSMI